MKVLCLALGLAAVQGAVFPKPSVYEESGSFAKLGSGFSFGESAAELASDRLLRSAGRYDGFVALKTDLSRRESEMKVSFDVASYDEELSAETDYSYEVVMESGKVLIKSRSVYGAMYAMESITQLITEDGTLSLVYIKDAPKFNWRGLMVDSGRRFFPVPTIENLLDTMSYVKMNVLHLHASDLCRFGVESKKFPNLTNSLTGTMAGFFTQEDIAGIVKYAGDRGIRVVPEFDVPGHSRGFLPLESQGMEFCTTGSEKDQLYNDPKNSTYNILTEIFTEMSALFPDKVFNIGSDETAAKGRCTVQSTFEIERALVTFVKEKLGKTPAGWEEIQFDAGAATQDTIVDAWARHSPGSITATGRNAIASNDSHFYFTEAAPGGPAGWSKCWHDISSTVPASQQNLLLGGEISMWTDTYCYIEECLNPSAGKPVGHILFDPKYDQQFGYSIGGMIWPRGYVAAAAFWNFNSSTDPTSATFTQNIWNMNTEFQKRGSWVCPTNCSCDQLTSCGKPYVQ
eukprot:TRINITY_DN27077_c0_g1_i1.p1 TRINITY_DN27077_c0_g1~~TRINITY_DN27077_c0_g1_i1.p1  ORF type:complete len:514 (+),score=104.10 TRINITY_DN27077_c0_g1_i1:40-1581(+)